MHALTFVTLISIPIFLLGLVIYSKSTSIDAENVGGAIAGFAAVIFVGGAIFSGVGYSESRRCETVADENNVDFRYGQLAGCRLELDDRFVPLDQWRVQEDR